MNGNKYFFDTNAIISFFQGHPQLKQFNSSPVSISIISVLEFLSFKNITGDDKRLFTEFTKQVEVVDLRLDNIPLVNLISKLRITYKLKLPDAIIVSSAIQHKASLVTNDKELLRIVEIKIVTF